MASPGWAQSVALSFGADSWAGWWRVTSGSWRSSGCEVSRADARRVFPAPGLFHAPEEARQEGVKLQPGADPQKGDGRWMAWRSLVGFVRNCHALLRGCELQPSARLEAGGQPGRPLPPHEYEGHAAGMAVGRLSPGGSCAWERTGLTLESEDAGTPSGSPRTSASLAYKRHGRLQWGNHVDFFPRCLSIPRPRANRRALL